MLRLFLFIISAITFNIPTYCQSYVRGVVTDPQNEPIEGVAVIMQSLDSIYIDAVLTDSSGIFTMKKAKENYRLLFQHLLCVPKQIEASEDSLGHIVLEEKAYGLNEIVVKGERPRIKVENGALTYDVSRLSENKVISNAYESILQLPGINEQDGALSLVGTNELTVILNGKPTTMGRDQLMTLLKNTPVSKVLKAEVIYNAPARYRVRGAVINLVLREESAGKKDFRGEVNTAYNQKHYSNASGGINLAYSSSKFYTDFLYSLGYNKTRSGLGLYSKHLLEGNVYNIEQKNNGYAKQLNHNIRWTANYSFASEDKISLTYTAALSPNKKSFQHSSGNISRSDIYNKRDENVNNINLDYTSHFGLIAGVDYTHYNSPSTQDFDNNTSEGDRLAFIANSNQKINRWKLYASQSHKLKQNFSVNYGTEFSYVDDNSYQRYETKEGVDMSSSDSQSNIKEYTYNLYGGIDKKMGDFSLGISLAGEYYKIAEEGDWSIYPTLQLNYMKSSGHIFQMSLSSNKTYPGYWLSQDNIGYLNGYAEIHGNPYLKPAKKYAARMNYILKSKYVFGAYYNRINDYFIQLPYQSADRLALIYQTLNFDTKQEMGLMAVIPFQVDGFWDTSLTLDGSYNREKCMDFHGMDFRKDKWRLFARWDNTLSLPSVPSVKIEIAGMYMSPLLQGLYDMSAMWQVDAGIKWSITKEMELKLKGTDLFNTFIPDMKVHYADQNLDVYPVHDNRSIMLSFSYKFGDYKKKKIKDVDTSRFGH